MSHPGVDIDVLNIKLEQVLVLLGHCQFNVPTDSSGAMDLMATALNFKTLKSLVDQCSKVLEGTLCVSNAITLFELGESKDIQNMSTAARKFILANFKSVYQTDRFLTLRVEHLTSFLKSDELQLDSEENVFEAINSWVKNDTKGRRGHVPSLMKTVRLVCCEVKFLKTLGDHFLLHENYEFKKDLAQLIDDMEHKPEEMKKKAEDEKRKPIS